ncbi:MAG: TldD/PmbA family protein [Acidobacteriota bacterium]|nr:TldD/PmbA family protein [Acidobacteriota bacterium]MDH3784197.1 TldD/PmbA family protein [Acidobacteriota bacterium]
MTPTAYDDPLNSHKNDDCPWLAAIRVGAAALPRVPTAPTLFHERRIDGWIEGAGSGPLREFVGTQSGLSIDFWSKESPWHRFRAGVGVEEIPAVVADWIDPENSSHGSSGVSSDEDGWTTKFRRQFPALRWEVESAIDAIEGGPADLRARVRWVGFDQIAIGAGGGEEPWRDRRQGSRVRVEAWHPDYGVVAVRERVLESVEGWGAALGAEAMARGLQVIDAGGVRIASAGTHNFLLGPAMGGVLVHELVGHALEGDVATQSWLATGPPLHPQLRVIDDPRRGRGAWRLDDQGVEARTVELIAGGRVGEPLLDLRRAAERGVPSNGHGRRAGYRDPVLPRMGATYIDAGDDDPKGMIADIKEGLYVRRIESASTDPKRGRGSFRVTESDRIVGGRLAQPIAPFLVDVNGMTLLRGPLRIGHDLTFDTTVGSCHRHGQPLATTVGGPTIWLGSMEIRT